MVTIKEVAKRAGVSHGTVSNVINNSGKVSSEKIMKVEKAMKELGYQPNVVARSLKEERSKKIALILPNLYSKEFLILFENLNRYAAKDGYSVELFITDEIMAREREMLTDAQMKKAEAAVIVTCQPEEEQFFDSLIKQGMKLIFVYREPSNRKYHFVGMHIKNVLEEKIEAYFREGLQTALIAGPQCYSIEQEAVNTYFQTYYKHNRIVNPLYIAAANYNRERAMEAALHILNLNTPPDVVIVTNEIMAEGVSTAFSTLKSKSRSIRLCMLSVSDWTDLERKDTEYLHLDYYKVGKMVYEDFVSYDHKENPGYAMIETRCGKGGGDPVLRIKEPGELIILLNECPSSEAVRLLLPDFEDKTGIHVHLETEGYKDLFQKIREDGERKEFDIYSIDLPWLKECVEDEVIMPLEGMLSPEALSVYSSEIMEKYSCHNGIRYAVPYSYTIQLLFYRKDLFEKLRNKRMYYEAYKEELKVPQTWREYNQIARFFTQTYNALSETKYGTTLGGCESSGAFCEFLPRLWEQGGKVENIEEEKWQRAAALYKECAGYADPAAVNWWWNEQVEEFYNGNAAMMMMYTEHIGDREHKLNTPVNGKVGVDLLPGKTSVLGGWSLGVRKGCGRPDLCGEFFKWIYTKELWVPNAVLGRIMPCEDDWYKNILKDMYRWFPVSYEGSPYTRARSSCYGRTETEIEKLVGSNIHEMLCENIGIDEMIKKLQKNIDTFQFMSYFNKKRRNGHDQS